MATRSEAPHPMARNRTTPAGKQILFHLLPRVVRSWFPARLQLQIEIRYLYLELGSLPPSKQIFEVLMYIHVLLDRIQSTN